MAIVIKKILFYKMTNIQNKQTFASELSFGKLPVSSKRKLNIKKTQMYKIIVATDHSAPAENAVDFAAILAKCPA